MTDETERTSRGRPRFTKGTLAIIVGILLLLGIVAPLKYWSDASGFGSSTSDKVGQHKRPDASLSFVPIPSSGTTTEAGQTNRSSPTPPSGRGGASTSSGSGSSTDSSQSGSSGIIIPVTPAWPSTSEIRWSSTDDQWYHDSTKISDPTSIRIVPGDVMIHRVTGHIVTSDNSEVTVRLQTSDTTITGDPALRDAVNTTTVVTTGGRSIQMSPGQVYSVTVASGQEIEFSVRITFDHETALRIAADERITVDDTIVHMSAL